MIFILENVNKSQGSSNQNIVEIRDVNSIINSSPSNFVSAKVVAAKSNGKTSHPLPKNSSEKKTDSYDAKLHNIKARAVRELNIGSIKKLAPHISTTSPSKIIIQPKNKNARPQVFVVKPMVSPEGKKNVEMVNIEVKDSRENKNGEIEVIDLEESQDNDKEVSIIENSANPDINVNNNTRELLNTNNSMEKDKVLGMFSYKKSLTTIFSHKHFWQKFHQKFGIFHEKSFNSL